MTKTPHIDEFKGISMTYFTSSWWKRPVLSPAAEKFNDLFFITILVCIVLPNALTALCASFALWWMR
jgi:hypothetical protein